MKVLLVGGVKDAKAKKFTDDIKKNVDKDAEVVFVNTFTNDPVAREAEENPDVVVMLSKQKFDFKAPIIDGLALVYPQMGIAKVYENLKKYV